MCWQSRVLAVKRVERVQKNFQEIRWAVVLGVLGVADLNPLSGTILARNGGT